MLCSLALAVALPAKTWTLVCGGDIMLNGIPAKAQPFKEIAAHFRRADLAYANLEIPLTTSKDRTPNKSAAAVKARNQFVLKADPGHITNLKTLGLDFASLGNNHAMDWGVSGLRQTTSILDKLGVAYSGAGDDTLDAERLVIREAPGGIKVGMLSYLAFVTPKAHSACSPAGLSRPGVATLSFGGILDNKATLRLSTKMAAAKKKVSVLLVAVHWGIERQTVPTRYQIDLAHALVDAGADVVLGAHPHVLQGTEVYNGKPIEYSMGNFVSPTPATSAIYRLTFEGTKFVGRERLGIKIAKGVIKRARVDYSKIDKGLARLIAPKATKKPSVKSRKAQSVSSN